MRQRIRGLQRIDADSRGLHPVSSNGHELSGAAGRIRQSAAGEARPRQLSVVDERRHQRESVLIREIRGYACVAMKPYACLCVARNAVGREFGLSHGAGRSAARQCPRTRWRTIPTVKGALEARTARHQRAGDRTRRPLPSRAARFFAGSRTEADSSAATQRRCAIRGATVLPGLIESHVHLENLGASLERVNLVGVKTETEAVDRVAARASSVPKGEWIIGWGWDEGAWASNYPDMRLLNGRAPIIRCCCMACTRSRRGETAWRSSARASRRRRQILPAEKSGKTSADSPRDPAEQRHAARRARDPQRLMRRSKHASPRRSMHWPRPATSTCRMPARGRRS